LCYICKKNKQIDYEQVEDALNIVNKYKIQLKEHYDCVMQKQEILKFTNVNKQTKIYDSNISIKTLNRLKEHSDKFGIEIYRDTKVGVLSKLSIGKFIKCRQVGMKNIEELKDLCLYANIDLLP
jgi:hypothetical protein